MSDHWEFYPCEMGEHQAFIFYDHGIREQIDGHAFELFPTDQEWRVIQDMKVLDALADHGDDPSVPRRIDHWSYFPASTDRDAFAAWAVANGFAIEGPIDPEGTDDEWGVQIYHEARPKLPEITDTTELLQEKAGEFGGNYDGWEN